jgi:hypothetical protein
MAASHKVKCRIVLALQHGSLNSSCFIYKRKNLNWTFDIFILRLSAAICTQKLTKLMTSTAVLPYFIHEANTKSSLHFTRILSSHGNNFICTGIIFNLNWISWVVTPCLWARISRRFGELCCLVFFWKLVSFRIIIRARTDVDGDKFWFCPEMLVPFERTKTKRADADTELFIVGVRGRLCSCKYFMFDGKYCVIKIRA